MRINEGFWIWGRFALSETQYLNKLKKKVNKNLNSPNFDVHLTLSGPYKKINPSFIENLNNLSKKKSPIILKLKDYQFKDEFFKAFYISVRNSKDLFSLRSDIFDLNKINFFNNYEPHISLAYGNFYYKYKEDLILNILKPPEIVLMDKLSLVYVNEKKYIWKILIDFDLQLKTA